MVDFANGTPIKASTVCQEFGISRRTFDAWMADGLRVFRMGKKLLYTTREELQRFARAVEAVQPALQPNTTPDAIEAERRVRERYAI